ncbi:MAG: formate/nitrite transporter family protein [Oscillospiraceae bacterium]|nr:formate/nitrite transporter family protein [Oscillospiraceae bacterium]
MKKDSFFSLMVKAVLSGLMIGVGGTVYLSCDNKYIGGFLFSFGLFTIIQYGFNLYTGKVGYIPEREPAYIIDVILIFLGNMIGTAAAAFALKFTRVWPAIHEKAEAAFDTKMSDGAVSRFILGVFCGLLMYLAVENARMCREKQNDTSMVFGVALPVMVFIFSGFNHSVADCFYLFASHVSPDRFLYILVVFLGNALGGMLIPLAKKVYAREVKA